MNRPAVETPRHEIDYLVLIALILIVSLLLYLAG
ncbi:putative integral membrane protein [Nakamurella sp. UYEF19]